MRAQAKPCPDGHCGRRARWRLDPRTKLALLFVCVAAASTAPSLGYELGLVVLIAVLALCFGHGRLALVGTLGYGGFCLLSLAVVHDAGEGVQAVMLAFLGMVHKIYPCGFMGSVLIATTRISEFLSAMNRLHAPKTLTIPLAIMLRYIPTIREDWHYIKDAMHLRDISPTLGGLIRRPAMTLECVYAPLLMAASKASDELSIASVTRGIENPKPRTCYVTLRLRWSDVLVLLCFLAYALGARGW